VADDWDSLPDARQQSAPAPVAQSSGWESLPDAAPRPVGVPEPLLNRMAEQPYNFEEQSKKWYSERLVDWTKKHIDAGDMATGAFGAAAVTGARFLEAIPKTIIGAREAAFGKGLTPEQEFDVAQEGAIVGMQFGAAAPTPALGGRAVLAKPEVKVQAKQAAAEVLKPVDEALAGSGLPPKKGAAAEEDLANAASVAGGHSGVDTGRGPMPLPRDQDFDTASKAIGGGQETNTKLRRLYEEQGVHPAEVLSDAQTKPEIRQSLLSKDPADLPRDYDPWAQIPGIGFHGYEPEFPAPLVPGAKPDFPPELTISIENAVQGIPSGKQVGPQLPIDAARLEPYFQNIPEKGKPKTAQPIPPMGGPEIASDLPGFKSFGIPDEGFDVFNPPEGPAARKPIYSYTKQDGSLLRRAYDGLIDIRNRLFTPQLVSDKALQAEPLFAEYKAAGESEKATVIAKAESYRQIFRQMSDTERLGYLDAMERGKTADMPKDLEEIANRHRGLLNEAFIIEKEYGSRAGFMEDYFGHIWQNPDKARGFAAYRTAQVGPTWFQKERVFPTIREGLDNGLRLKYTNPEDIVTHRLLSSIDMQQRVELLRSLEKMDLAKTIEEGKAGQLEREGWQLINAPDRQQWALSPDVQYLWRNAVEAKGFWGNEGVPGNIFRGFMALKQVWVPIKLALSMFHPLHVLHIYWNNALARAWVDLTRGGDAAAALSSAKEGFYGPWMTDLGKNARVAWKIPEMERTPEQSEIVTRMKEGGFSPEIPLQLKIDAQKQLEEALDKGEWLKAGFQGVRRTIQAIQKPLFEEWIPNIKAQAYLHDTANLLARRPDLLDDPVQRQVMFNTIRKSVDNRFGEMFYGGLFWDRYVKDAGIASFLSLGWNLGFAREFIGGPLEGLRRTFDKARGRQPTLTEANIADAQNKIPFAVSYMSTAMLINGMMSFAMSGQAPTGMDWIFARTGGTNPDNSPRRITNMFYLREIPMLLKHIEQQGGSVVWGAMDMIRSKLMFEPFIQMMENRDYYGTDIWDVNGPLYKKAWQQLKFIFGDQMMPISVTGAERAYMEGQWYEPFLAMLGFGPAPRYVDNTATANRIDYLWQRHAAPESRPQVEGEKMRSLIDIRSELLRAKQNHDRAGIDEAARKWMDGGGSRQAMANMVLGIGPDISKFRALPESDQKAIMEGATPEEQAKYRPFMKTNAAAHAAEMLSQYQILNQQGNTAGAQGMRQQLQSFIRENVQNGTITDVDAFRRSLAQQMIARRAPELSAFMGLPKKVRPQYAPQLQSLH
jgi:hypothetical protein